MRRGLALAAALAIGVAACGPHPGRQTGITTQLTNLLLGPPPAAPTVPGLPPPTVVPTFPGVPLLAVQPPLPLPAPTVVKPTLPRPAPTCPVLAPTAVPLTPVLPSIVTAPPAGRYAYRQTGAATVDGKPAGALHGTAIWTVAPAKVTNLGESLGFSVTSPSFEGATTTATYGVLVPITNSLPVLQLPLTAGRALPIPGGLFLTKLVTINGNTSTGFTPVGLGLEMFAEPGEPHATWESAAVDPAEPVVVDATGDITADTHVDACGTALDAWGVHFSETILGVDENLTETDTLAIGTEFGGLPLSDDKTVTGTVSGHRVQETSDSTIDSPTPIEGTSGGEGR